MYKKEINMYDYIKKNIHTLYNDENWTYKSDNKNSVIEEFINDNSIEYIINKIGIEKVELALRKLKIEKIKNKI